MAKRETVAGTVRKRGQVTVPADVRRKLGIEEGDTVVMSVAPLEEEVDL